MVSDMLSTDALLLVLETVNKQAAQIKRLEAIVAGGSSTGTGLAVQHGAGCHNGPLAAELQQLSARLAALEQVHQQADADAAASAGRLQQLEQRVQSLQQQGQQLQQQLGAPATQQQHRVPISSSPAPQGTTTTARSSSGGGQRSMTVRLQQLERQVECLAGSAADVEDKLATASAAVHALDRQLSKQLSNVRADVQQALAVTAGSVKAELEAAAAARDREAARQLQKQLQELSATFQCRLSECQRAAAADCKRQAAASQEAAESRLTVLRAQLDRFDAEKADISLVTNYTGQVADVFEQLATTVADSTQASIAQLLAQQQELRGALTSLAASKVDSGSMLQHQHDCQQQLLELQRSVAAAHSTANDASLAAAVAQAAAEPVAGLRMQLAEAQGILAALHAQTASLEASFGSICSGQQQHTQELQQLAQSHQSLQQQLLALGNHVDPAAAAQLAAAMNGDESALSFQPLGDTQLRLSLDLLAGPDGGEDTWLTGCYMQAGATPTHGAGVATSGAGAQQQQPQPESSGGALAAFAAAMQRVQQQQQGGGSGVPRSSAGASRMAPCQGSGGGGGTRMGAVLRHLPVAVRLQRLEAGVRELCGDAASKATDGELQALAAQHEQLLERLHVLSATCEGLSRSSSSSMQQLQQQVEALSSSLEDRPSRAQVAAALSDAEAAAAAAASKTSLAAVQQLQQQLADLQEGVAAAHVGVQQLKASEMLASNCATQLRGQLMSELDSRAAEMQQALTQHLRTASANQEAAAAQHGSPPKLASLESKLRGLVSEVDGMREQAALTARMQDKHTTMVSALEAALQAQASKHATLLQQLRLELKEAVAKAAQAHGVRTGAVEAALQEQAAALAAAVAELTDKACLAQDALQQFQAGVEQQLLEHVKREEGRWEAWLPQFVRSMEQRPTAGQLQKQLEAAQQQTASNAQEAAVARMQCVAAAADTALRSQLHTLAKQLHTLQDRTLLLEQGTGIGEEADEAQAGGVEGPQQAPATAAAAAVAGHPQQQQQPASKPTAQAVAAAWRASPALNRVPPLPLPVAHPKLRKTAVLPAVPPSQPAGTGQDKGKVSGSAAGSPAAVQAAAEAPAATVSAASSTLTTSQELVALAARVPRPPAAAAHPSRRRASTSSSCSGGTDDVPEPSQAAGDPAAADGDCEAELEQLLALQQQVQSCLISNGCVAVGRRQRKSSAERQARGSSRRSRRQAGAASPGRACDEADGGSSVPASPSPAAGEAGGAAADSDAGSGQQPAVQPPQRKERHESRRSAVAGQQRQQPAVTEADVQQLLALQHQVLQRLEQQGCVPTPVGQQQTLLGREETSDLS